MLILLSHIHLYTNNEEAPDADEVSQEFAERLNIWIDQELLALSRHACGIGAQTFKIVTPDDYLKDPLQKATQAWIESNRRSAPNGSLMRTHPIGVVDVGMSEVATWELSTGVGQTTHVDPCCVVSCCIEVALIRGLLRGERLVEQDLDSCAEWSYKWVKGKKDLINPGSDNRVKKDMIESRLNYEEFQRHVYARSFEELQLDDQEAMGNVYKCLASAILTLRKAMRNLESTTVVGLPIDAHAQKLFEQLMTELVMEGGDADTNGAAAGALLGAYVGYSNLHIYWKGGLAHHDWLAKKIARLATATGIVIGELKPENDEAVDGPTG